jgi:hypothetical protein
MVREPGSAVLTAHSSKSALGSRCEWLRHRRFFQRHRTVSCLVTQGGFQEIPEHKRMGIPTVFIRCGTRKKNQSIREITKLPTWVRFRGLFHPTVNEQTG